MKCIVIGAGILGASAAYQLAKRGEEVLLIDRQDHGQATNAAAGIICPWLSQRRNQSWYRLAKAGARYYPELVDELKQDGETDTGYARVGALHIHQEPEKLAKLEERARLRREDAPEIGEIAICGEQETVERFPPLSDVYQAVHVSGAARVDGRALRDALIRSARRHGAEFRIGDAALTYEQNRVTGVAVDGQSIPADKTIICAGAWAAPLLQPLGIRFLVSYQKAQITHVQLQTNEDTGEWPVVMPPSNQYLLAFEDRRIVMGSTHEDVTEVYDTRATAGGMQEILSKGLAVAPGLADATYLETRVGFRPFTPGFLPVIGEIPGWEGLVAANGLGSSGLTVGPFLGLQLAKLAMGLPLDIEAHEYDIRTAIGS
nr:FAD-dependent oxidoreductase [Paenibacillus soyae]